MAQQEILEPEADKSPHEIAPMVDESLAIGLSRAEIDTQILTARRFPREISKVAKNILSMATLDEETAEECQYALPRGGKPIQGPSIRFAEIVESCFGNCRSASRVVFVDRVEKVVIAEGIFHDLETNHARRAEVRRRITDKNGRLYSADMIVQTGNAACSIAIRNAILAGIPKPLWRQAYAAVQKTIVGDIKTLAETREKAIKALANFGATPEMVFKALGVAGAEDIKVEHIAILRGMFSALKSGEATAEEVFSFKVAAEKDPNYNPLAADEEVDQATGEITKKTPGTDTPPPSSVPGSASSADDARAAAGAPSPTNRGADTPTNGGAAPVSAAQAGADIGGGGNDNKTTSPKVSVPKEVLQEFSKALMRAARVASLEKIRRDFWKDKLEGIDEASQKRLDAIAEAHVKRVEGGDIGEFDKRIKEIVG